MKRMILILTALMIAGGIQAAENDEIDLSKARCMYIRGIEKGNLGLQCDAIYRLAQMKYAYPELETGEMCKVLEKILSKETHGLVRIYAELTLSYLNDADLRQMAPITADEISIDFYQKLQNELYQKTWLLAVTN
jgi:hypothetical protein